MDNITIRNAELLFRNFSGRSTQFTPEGRRSFSVLIDDGHFANSLIADGWNIKPLKPRDDNDPPRWQLPVAVFFGKYPPMITMISGNTKTLLGENDVGLLDWADITKVGLIIRPREYDAAGRHGVKAYLKTMYVTVQEDELAKEYADIGIEEEMPF